MLATLGMIVPHFYTLPQYKGLTVLTAHEELVQLDVTDGESIEAARAEILERTGGEGLGAIVHAAGFAELGPLMLVTDAALERHFETNVFGAMAVTRAFLPEMKARRAGRIVHVGSVVDRLTLATHGAYGASMHALRALNDTLRQELALFGVEVVLVQPGTVRTPFLDDAFRGLDAKRWSGSRWNPVIDRLQGLERSIRRLGVPPERVAKLLGRAIEARRPQRRYVLANPSAITQLAAARLLPTEAFDGLVRGTLGLAPRRPAPVERTVYKARPVALITGAGGGIGSRAALRLARAGYRVFATDKDEEALAHLGAEAEAERLELDLWPLDVTDARSVAATRLHVREATEGHGVDLLVNNAGYAELGPLDLADGDAYRRQFAVNVIGLMRITRGFAAAMADRRSGRIINVSSVLGVLAFPFLGVYQASKHAVEALSDALRQELGPFGVDVVLVEPSFVSTGFAQRARQTLEQYDGQAHDWGAAFARMDEIERRLTAVGCRPEEIAEVIHEAARAPRPEARYQAPLAARVAVRAAPWVPAALTDRLLRRAFALDAVERDLD